MKKEIALPVLERLSPDRIIQKVQAFFADMNSDSTADYQQVGAYFFYLHKENLPRSSAQYERITVRTNLSDNVVSREDLEGIDWQNDSGLVAEQEKYTNLESAPSEQSTPVARYKLRKQEDEWVNPTTLELTQYLGGNYQIIVRMPGAGDNIRTLLPTTTDVDELGYLQDAAKELGL